MVIYFGRLRSENSISTEHGHECTNIVQKLRRPWRFVALCSGVPLLRLSTTAYAVLAVPGGNDIGRRTSVPQPHLASTALNEHRALSAAVAVMHPSAAAANTLACADNAGRACLFAPTGWVGEEVCVHDGSAGMHARDDPQLQISDRALGMMSRANTRRESCSAGA
jgi:hypothetical protein